MGCIGSYIFCIFEVVEWNLYLLYMRKLIIDEEGKVGGEREVRV